MSQSGPLVITGGVGSSFLIQEVRATFNTPQTCTTRIPFDNTIPQNTEGDEVITVTITPSNAASILRIEFNVWGGTQGSNPVVALFQDAGTDAISVLANTLVTQGFFNFIYYMTAGTTLATTFKIRMGTDAGAFRPLYILADQNGNPIYGGAFQGSLSVNEFAN